MVNHYRLSEKLKDLREERNLKLEEVVANIIVDGVPISIHTLQRLEDTDKSYNSGYKNITELAKFYGVSTDYLMDMTDNRKYKLVGINELSLSDEAIEVLNSKKLNNRLISELLSHQDFQQLLLAIEMYIDRKIAPQINTMNSVYKLVEDTIRENYVVPENDETIMALQEAVVDEDEYLRFRISERFNGIMKKLFELHKKDVPPGEESEMVKEMKEDINTYISHKEQPERGKIIIFAKKIGLNLTRLTDEEINVLTEALKYSDLYKRSKKKKK